MKTVKITALLLLSFVISCSDSAEQITPTDSVETILASEDLKAAETAMVGLEEKIQSSIAALPHSELMKLKATFSKISEAEQLAKLSKIVGNVDAFHKAIQNPMRKVISRLQQQGVDRENIASMLADRLTNSNLRSRSFGKGKEAPGGGTGQPNYEACVNFMWYVYNLDIQNCFRVFSSPSDQGGLNSCLLDAELLHTLALMKCIVTTKA